MLSQYSTEFLREAHSVPESAASFCSIIWLHSGTSFVTSCSLDNNISVHNGSPVSTTPPTIIGHPNHKDGVTALALSPDDSLLATGSKHGCLKLYKFSSKKWQHIKEFSFAIRVLAFNGSGTLLAVGGDNNGIKIFETSIWYIKEILFDNVSNPVTGLDFDPKGELLASIDNAGHVKIWEVGQYKVLRTLIGKANPKPSSRCNLRWSPNGERLAVPGPTGVSLYPRNEVEQVKHLKGNICYVAWAPSGEHIVTSGMDNQVRLWHVETGRVIHQLIFDDVICCMAWKPDCDHLSVMDVKGKFLFLPSLFPVKESSTVDTAHRLERSNDVPKTPKNLNKGNGDDRRSRKIAHNEKKHGVASGVSGSIAATTKCKMQKPFQPGETPLEPGKRRVFCYNMVGSIFRKKDHIQAELHDTGKGLLMPPIMDAVTVASINESGCVFAYPCKEEKNRSVLMYRPFKTSLDCSKANNVEWTKSFNGEEEVMVVAIGSGWVAAVTSLNYLHIFSEGGLQMDIVSLVGPVVASVGCKDQLAVVFHVSDCLPSNEQVMKFIVWNMSSRTQQSKGRVALTPGSHLTWIGFSEEGYFSSYDSKGVLRIFNTGTWIPVLSTSEEKKQKVTYWMVGLDNRVAHCIECKHPQLFPQTVRRVEDMALSGVDTTAVDNDNESFDLHVSLETCMIKLIYSCCNSGKFARAIELMKLLHLPTFMEAATLLVTSFGDPSLAEKFNNIREERLREEPYQAITKKLEPAQLAKGLGAKRPRPGLN